MPGFLPLMFFLTGVLSFTSATAQTRIIQWSDAHSSLQTISQQLYAIDEKGREFLAQNPKGEVVVVVLGDFTSINPFNLEDGGEKSIEALKLLRQRGHTVIFVPGNHDAFDWTVRTNGAELFLQQMNLLKKWGIPVLAENLKGMTPKLQELTLPYYPLEKSAETVLLGLTLPNLLSKSNLTDASSKILFQGIEYLGDSMDRLLPEVAEAGFRSAIFGIHVGHQRLGRMVPTVQNIISKKQLDLRVPLLMAGHDHLAAFYSRSNTLIADGASHGSFNVIDISAEGEVRSESLTHVAINEEQYRNVRDFEFRKGELTLNSVTRESIASSPWLSSYQQEIERQLDETRARMSKGVELLWGLPEHKMDLRRGQTLLGQILGEASIRWAQTKIPANSSHSILAMINSSSYRMEESLPPGRITEFDIRMMYPFLTMNYLALFDGATIEKLYFSLREFYAHGEKELHSPQLSFNARERQGSLEIRSVHGWKPIQPSKKYWLVVDGWLAEHQHGQSYRVPEWIEQLQRTQPIATETYQEVLVKHLPKVLQEKQHLYRRSEPKVRARLVCHEVYQI